MKFRNNLFWFLKNNAKINPKIQSELDMYVQQTLTRGKTNDIKNLLMTIKPLQLRSSFYRLSQFLPLEVKKFWEDFFGSTNAHSKRNT